VKRPGRGRFALTLREGYPAVRQRNEGCRIPGGTGIAVFGQVGVLELVMLTAALSSGPAGALAGFALLGILGVGL